MQEDTRIYWFGPLGSVIPYVQFVLLIYLALVCSRGLQTVERGTGFPSIWCECGKELSPRLDRAVAGESRSELLRCLSQRGESACACVCVCERERGSYGVNPLCKGKLSPLYMIGEGTEYVRERERVPTSSVASVVAGPPRPVIAALLLCGRVLPVA